MTEMTMLEERGPKPYGDVAYADPKNGKYPIDTEAHIRAAWSYINMPKNAAKYPLNGVTLDSVKSRIKAAMAKLGADVSGKSSADRAGFELRRRHRLQMVAIRERRGMSFQAGNVEVRAQPNGTGGTTFLFEGYGSVFDSPFEMWDKWGDPYTEVVMQGAFTNTLARPDVDVPFLIGHNDAGIPLARTRAGTMQLAQDTHGLHVLAQMDGSRSDVRDLASAVERGDLDEMSIGFVTRGQEWSDDFETRSMLDLDLHRGDVSAVALGALPATSGSTMTALPAAQLARLDPAAEELMLKGTELRLPMIDAALDQAAQIFSKADLTSLPPEVQNAVQLVASAGVHVDHILKKEGLPDPDQGAKNNFGAPGDPDGEVRASPIDQNLGDAPDYNAGPKAAPPLVCVNQVCPLNGTNASGPQAKYCPRCGQMLGGPRDMSGGSKVITLVDGIPSDERPGGVNSLAQRRREIELLALGGRAS